MENTPAKDEKKTALAPWKQSLIIAEAKFLAISDPERTKIELGFAAQLIQANPSLQKCNPESIINAVINVARTGITLNPVMKLAHLVPRDGKCVLDFDYKGLVKILKDHRCCKDIQAVIVYEDEEFEDSINQTIAHKHVVKHAKTEEEHKKRVKMGVYCRVLLMDSTMIFTSLMPWWRILKAKKVSKYDGIWNAWEEEMAMKTKIKYDFKTLVSGNPAKELVAALELEEDNNGMTDGAKKGNPTKAIKSIADAFGAEDTPFEENPDAGGDNPQ